MQILRRVASSPFACSSTEGHLQVVDPSLRGGSTDMPTFACCHCNTIVIMRPGSGIQRGFCTKCTQLTCGRAECHECVPFAKRLELYEKGKIADLFQKIG